jgi:hypothetical protein
MVAIIFDPTEVVMIGYSATYNVAMTPNELALTTLAASGISSGLIAGALTTWMTRKTNKDVEQLKSALEKGSYVTKSHYDLELESFKEIWNAVSELRLRVRAFVARDEFGMKAPSETDVDDIIETLMQIIQDFFSAHDNALRITMKSAPFYPESIRKAVEELFESDLRIIKDLKDEHDKSPFTPAWIEKFRHFSKTVDDQVYRVETMIRSRLEDIRVVR